MTRVLVGVLLLTAAALAACSGDASMPTSPSSQTGGSPGTAAAPASSTQGQCTLPPAPTNLRVTSMVGAVVELSWNAVANAVDYTLLVGSRPGATDILNANTSQASFRFTAKDGRQYARVQAQTACGGGPATGSIDFTVRP